MDIGATLYVVDRADWRKWLSAHFQTEPDVWLVYPKKATGKPKILYNDAVEVALCFGWIDSIIKSLDADHSAQRFSPRKPRSGYSQPNKERLAWLLEHNLIHPSLKDHAREVLAEPFVFPPDVMEALRKDPITWANFQGFNGAYQRIRVAYIDTARKRPAVFETRLQNLLEKTRAGKMIRGYGGIEKYY
jgi:uncharacterized protein YdeI (YjbR/CyaY-like superfamily)